MELIRLDDSLQPEALVEGYNSLIWTERYSTNGEFQLTSYDIANTMGQLPLDAYISLRDSTVPMIVEQYKIEKPKNDLKTLTVVGRTVETCLERRGAVNVAPSIGGTSFSVWGESATKSSDAAFQAMRKVIGDHVQPPTGTVVLDAVTAPVPEDAFPELNLVLPADYIKPTEWSNATAYSAGDYVSYAGIVYLAVVANTNAEPDTNPSKWYPLNFEIPFGDLYSAMTNLLAANYHGIKSVRPMSGEGTFDVEIYNGADRSGSIVFDARFDQFTDTAYLFTDQGSTNVAYTKAADGKIYLTQKTTTNPSGMARRVLPFDLSSETVGDPQSRALIELYKYNSISMFDGTISADVAKGYNNKYFLGDIVKLQGEYGVIGRLARITEFIRSSDTTGETAYPTLEIIGDAGTSDVITEPIGSVL